MPANFLIDLRAYVNDALSHEHHHAVDGIFNAWGGLIPDYATAYSHLSDSQSKRCYVAIIAARMFWHLQKLSLKDEVIFPPSAAGRVTDMAPYGLDIFLDIDAGSRYLTFEVEQYRYFNGNVVIEARNGDIVVDGGGYVGDSALYFANRVGPQGCVFAFEFIPNNVRRWKENADRNPLLSSQMHLLQYPLWSTSGVKLGFEDEGAASRVSESSEAMIFETLTIDDMVESKGLNRIDFIKLDIEGAEVEALKGAEKTIRAMKPKLGVCLYHDSSHFSQIPLMLKEMNPNYAFYVRHMTAGLGETVLYAVDQATS